MSDFWITTLMMSAFGGMILAGGGIAFYGRKVNGLS